MWTCRCGHVPGLETHLYVSFLDVTKGFDDVTEGFDILPSHAACLACGSLRIPIIDSCLKTAWKTERQAAQTLSH